MKFCSSWYNTCGGGGYLLEAIARHVVDLLSRPSFGLSSVVMSPERMESGLRRDRYCMSQEKWQTWILFELLNFSVWGFDWYITAKLIFNDKFNMSQSVLMWCRFLPFFYWTVWGSVQLTIICSHVGRRKKTTHGLFFKAFSHITFHQVLFCAEILTAALVQILFLTGGCPPLSFLYLSIDSWLMTFPLYAVTGSFSLTAYVFFCCPLSFFLSRLCAMFH